MRDLSLTARLAVALHCVEGIACRVGLSDSAFVKDFLDFLWDWPIVEGLDAFRAFEVRDKPHLVDVGLGDDYRGEFLLELEAADISESQFREVLEATVEILYGSFYGAAQDEESAAYLSSVTSLSREFGLEPPPLWAFAASRFLDRQVWGTPLSREQRDRWRCLQW